MIAPRIRIPIRERSRADARQPGNIDQKDIVDALSNICASEGFRNSARMQTFLTYVVTETIEGRADRIKSYTIATEVFLKSPSSAAADDSIVRTAGTRLRLLLDRYNATISARDAIKITLPKGTYIPIFSANRDFSHVRNEPSVLKSKKLGPPRRPGYFLLGGGLLACLAAVILPQQRPAEQVPTLYVQPLRTAKSSQTSFGNDFSSLLVSHLANYGGANVIDATIVQEKEAHTKWGYKAGYLLSSSVVDEDTNDALVWRVSDIETHEVLWASREEVGSLEKVDVETLAKRIAVHVLGLNGAIPRIAGIVGIPTDCVTRGERISLVYHFDFEPQVHECLKQLVKMKPTNADAWALLAQTYLRIARQTSSFGNDPGIYKRELQHAALQAKRLAPNNYSSRLAEMYAALDANNIRDFTVLAHRLLHDFHDPHLKIRIGAAHVAIGRLEEGEQLLNAGLAEIDFGEVGPALWLSYASYFRGDYERGLDKLNEAAGLEFYQVHLLRTVLLAELGRHADARATLEELHLLRPRYEEHFRFDLRNSNFADAHIEKIGASLQALTVGG